MAMSILSEKPIRAGKEMNSFYSKEEILEMQFRKCGEDVSISRKAVFYSPENIEIGSHVRIDDFCFISGGKGTRIGDYVHIASYSALYGKFGIEIGDYVNISSRVNIYSTSDDYSGEYLAGPLVKEEYIHDIGMKIVIEDLVIIGAGSVILPGGILREGAAVGAMSLIKSEVPSYHIYAGAPAKFLRERSRSMLKYLEDGKEGSEHD